MIDRGNRVRYGHGRLDSNCRATAPPAPPDLSKLSHAEKDRLILALIGQLAAAQETIATQETRIATLEARLYELTRPPKTPDTNLLSKPPSQGQKPKNRPAP